MYSRWDSLCSIDVRKLIVIINSPEENWNPVPLGEVFTLFTQLFVIFNNCYAMIINKNA